MATAYRRHFERHLAGCVMGFLLGLFPARLWIYAAIAAIIFALGGTAAWQVQEWRYGKKEADRLAKIVKVAEKQVVVDNKATEDRVKTVTVYKQGATKIVERIVYETISAPAPSICDRSPASLHDLTELINAANGAR